MDELKRRIRKPKLTGAFNTRLIARFGLSGLLGIVVGLLLYEFTYAISAPVRYRATFSYVVSYLVGIVVQHALHRQITFGKGTPYLRSLRRTFVVYPIVLLVGSAANLFFVRAAGLHHRLAFWLTVVVSGLLSFVGLRFFAFNAPLSDPQSSRSGAK
jgi:putative flippase GtrA